MRKLMWFSIGFALSCGLGAYVFLDHFLLYGLIALIVGIGSLIGSHWFKFLRIGAALLVSFAVGTGWFLLYNSLYLSDARDLDGNTNVIELEITDYGCAIDSGYKVGGKLDTGDRCYNVLVYLDDAISCKPGDTLSGVFYLRFTAEGGIKDPTYHRGEGVFLLAYPSGDIKLTEADAVPERYFHEVLRNRIIQLIDAVFPEREASFAKAVLLGERSGIDYETNAAFKVSGISHIVAVSGLHVSILFGIAAMLSGRKRIFLFCIGMPLLILFAAVAGFTPSVTRACIMQALMLTSLLVNKEYDPPTALSTAALVMLIINPMVIISISFQLSFACMIGIFLFSGRIYDWFLDENRLGRVKSGKILSKMNRWFARSVSVSVGASVMTTPLVAIYFGTVSLVGILTNLLVVWVVSYVFYGVMLACCLGAISIFTGKLIAYLTLYPIRFVIGTAKLLASLPLSAVYTESAYVVIWLVFTYVLLAVFLCMRKKRVIEFCCLSCICLCAALSASWIEPLLDSCRVTVLDVGQGQCILLQSEGRTFLVDCGGSSAWDSADKAAETLLSQGISKLDGVIVTHYDEDHAAGIPLLLSRVPADVVYIPEISDSNGVTNSIETLAQTKSLSTCEDLHLIYGQTEITIFGPESYNLGNESSLCILFRRENCDILITGDRGSVGEMLLLYRTDLPKLDVLIAGHHGSAGSTGEALLAATEPKYVLISAGRNNRYGHPAQALLDRLIDYGCKIFRTDINGTIIYRG